MSDVAVLHNYLLTKKLDVDLAELVRSCELLNQHVREEFKHSENGYGTTCAKSAESLDHYNLFLYPFPGFYELAQQITELFKSRIKSKHKYYLKGWINYYNYGDYVDWHHHKISTTDSAHGFFCVHAQDSVTTYRVRDDEFHVQCEDGLLVLGETHSDVHRTWPWHDKSRPRITIAFDIVPIQAAHKRQLERKQINHWMPIL